MASTTTKRSTRPTLNAAAFPMTYSKSFSQWWSSGHSSAVEAQKAVLSFLPFYPEKDDKRTASVNLVHLSGKNRSINELEITRGDEPVERTLVMLHGYGAGLGLFYRYFRILWPY
jgi:cardiolipin-specific phospholipase